MGLVTPDFSEVSEREPLKPGTYSARVTGLEPVESKAGKPMLKWTWEVFGSEEQGVNGRIIFDRTMLSGPGAFRTQKSYAAVMKEKLSGSFDTEMLLGKEALLTVATGKNQDGSDSNYPEVKDIKSI